MRLIAPQTGRYLTDPVPMPAD